MKKQKITMSECLVWGSAVLIIAMISVSAYLSTKEQEKPITGQGKLYEDSGQGIMIMKKYDIYILKEGYLQWKKDYPERDKKIVATAISGGSGSYFMLIYRTE